MDFSSVGKRARTCRRYRSAVPAMTASASRDQRSHVALENCRASTSIYLLRSRYVNRRKELPSYKEPTVDALAPDADEGRGRLR
jgi:hypothetical protein